MCGIAGGINNMGFNIDDIVNMSNLIKHRGPNDEGFIIQETCFSDIICMGGKDTPEESYQYGSRYAPMQDISGFESSNVVMAFGHRRLSILDLSPAGHQPMSFSDGRYWIVLNGEIYNYLEVKSELITKGYTFESNSDTEVVLASWQEWGAGCLDRFIGMWSFVIFDKDNRTIFLTRDRFGIKPLYYWTSPGGTFYFASEIKQFTVLPEWKALLNHQRAADYLYYSGLTDHTEETLFRDVFQLTPGHSSSIELDRHIFVHGEKIKAIKWYNPTVKKYKGSYEEAVVEFKTKFDEAVALHLRADVPIGSALSGGLDSSSIVCTINQMLTRLGKSELQNTFSSVHTDPKFSEKEWIDSVVSEMKVKPHFVYPAPENMLLQLDQVIWHLDEPYQSQSAFLGYEVFKSAKNNNTVVLLNGQGADEYLSGYGAFKFLRHQQLDILKRIKMLKLEYNINSFGAISLIIKNNIKFLYHSLPLGLKSILNLFNGKHKAIKKSIDHSILESSILINPYQEAKPDFGTTLGISNFQLYTDALPRYLRWEDRNSMAHSIEARVPFLDHRLVELCHSLPIEYLDAEDKMKRILVDAMVDILPEKVRNRKDKKGFLTPEEKWLKTDFTNELRSLLIESINGSKGIITKNALNYFNDMAGDKIPFDGAYWRLIMFGIWMKRFNIQL